MLRRFSPEFTNIIGARSRDNSASFENLRQKTSPPAQDYKRHGSGSDNSLPLASKQDSTNKSVGLGNFKPLPSDTDASIVIINQRSSAPSTSLNLSLYDQQEQNLEAKNKDRESSDGGSYATSAGDELKRYFQLLVLETEKLTKEIQKLLVAAQESNVDNFPQQAILIQSIVDHMITSLPEKTRQSDEPICKVLDAMVDASIHLTILCTRNPREWEIEQFVMQVVHAAYDVAKCAKQMLSLLQMM